jgi:arsenite methyltransferase
MLTEMSSKIQRQDIQAYYGKVLQSSSDLKTNACCLSEAIPEAHRKILAEIPSEILEKFYGCGSPIPAAPEGRVILDLGCGTGRDAYLIARLAGPAGKVISSRAKIRRESGLGLDASVLLP